MSTPIDGEGLRVLFVSANRRWTGGERCMTAVASGLAERQHEVAFAFDPRGPVGDRLEPHVQALPVAVRNDADPAALLALWSWIRRLRPQVVCVNTFRELKVGGTAARLAVVGRSAPRVVNRMGGVDALYNGSRERLVYRALLDVLVRDSEWAAEKVRRENPWFDRPVLWARNGVDTAALAELQPLAREELGARPGEVLVAALGRVEARKGALDLADAAALLAGTADAGAGFRLVFIGEPAAGVERELAQRLGPAAPRVALSLHGPRSPREALRALAACDILAHPTHSDSVPYAVLEGMALGLPVVATAVGGLPQVVVEGSTGALVPPGDPMSLARGLASLIAQEHLRHAWGDAGRRRARECFDVSHMVDDYERAFRMAVME